MAARGASIELLAPVGLALLALLVPLVILYILKIKRKRRRVGSIWLWQIVQRDLMARSPFRRLHAEVPLIVEAAALGLLALALARPATRGRAFTGDHVAIVIDTSASMSASALGPRGEATTRIALARHVANDLLSSLAPGSDALVLAAGRETRFAAALDRDVTRLRAAIDQIDSVDVEGDLDSALALAVDRLRPLGGARRIVVITDGDLASSASLTRAALPIEVIKVGTPIENTAIVRVDVRSGNDPVVRREQVQGFLVVANFGKAPRDVFVTMREQNASDVLASRRVLVQPGERLPVVLTFHPTPGDYKKGLIFEIAPHDAMPVDDVAYGRVPAGDSLPVLLAGEAPWIERALRSDPRVDLRTVPLANLAAGADADALVVVAGACPPDPPGGDLLIVNPPQGWCFGTDVGAPVEHPDITSWDNGDARLRFLTLDGVHVARANLLQPMGSSAALIHAQQGTIAVDISTAARTGTLVGFDVGESDWPLKASFVLFVRNVLEQARAHRAHGITGPARTGEPMRVSLPPSARDVAALGARGEAIEVSRRGGFAVLPSIDRAGFYTLTWQGPQAGSILVPANLASAAESDLAQRPIQVDGANVAITPGERPADAHSEWTWVLALAALALIVLDVAYLTRAARGRSPTRGFAGIARRPLLLAGMILGALPALHVGLAWAALVSNGYLRLARPWAALLVLGATSFIAFRLLREDARQGRWRAWLRDLLAMASTLAAAMAVTGPELGRPLDRLTVLIAVDRSRSIDLVPSADARIAQELRVAELGMREDDRIATLAFASEARTEDAPRPKSQLGSPQHVAIGRDGTDLAAAIRCALAEVPPDSAARIVLLSDGVATRGDTMAAAASAVAAAVPIDVVPLEQRTVPDVRVIALRAPTRADEGESIDLRLVTSSPAPADVAIRVRRDGELIAKASARIAAGEDVLRIRQHAPGPGLHRYDVDVTALDPALDQAPEDNAGSAFVRVRGKASALVLEGDEGQAAFIVRSLEASAFRVDTGVTRFVPSELGGLAGYDVIVLSDVRAADLTPGQIDALASYVRDLGGGLVLMGGDRSMGPGGYARTPIEEVSPVAFDLKQDRRRASLAEVIGIDISGSMGAEAGGRTKLELANEAAARSAALLGAGDRLGVEHVDTLVHWTVPLGPILDTTRIERAIRGVDVGAGGIYVDITLDAGYAALDREQVNLKHMLLFADGSDAENIAGCRAKVGEALKRGITTSVVALGSGSDVPELETLSRLGTGRFYLIEDAQRLPAVFAQETILASRSAIVEKSFSVARGDVSSITAGIDFAEAPALRGYVVTLPKSRASVLLTGPDGDPILAAWSAGVGRAAAFTSDLKDRWGRDWTSWPGAALLIAQAARDVARKGEDGRVRIEADAEGGELHVRAFVVGDDGRAQSFRRFTAHVVGPDGLAREIALEASGAGAYTATTPLARPGTYLVAARDETTGETVGTTGAVLTAGEELRPTGSDVALLARIAELTGGKRRDTLAGIFADRGLRRFAYEDVTSALVVLAAFGLLFSVAARRFAVPDEVLAWAARAPEAPAPPTAEASVAAPGRKPSAAEILLARRKGKRP